jgi:hypothetical protein
MKIYKGDVGIDLTVDAFLELLEEDALDEAINMVLDLEATGSIKGDFDGDIIYMGAIDLDEFDGDISGLFDHITDNIEHYEVISEEDFESVFGAQSAMGGAFLSDEDIINNFLFSNEDLRVKRIAQRFRHIDDAS